LTDAQYTQEDDIHDYFEKYNFTDGCGRMSPSLALKLSHKLSASVQFSAFQIRFNGCKGVVVSDTNLSGYELVFRKSMNKFKCSSSFPEYNQVEICSPATFHPCFLNRNVIQVLEEAKISQKVFLELQNNAVKPIDSNNDSWQH
jgi:RNA-dependent RNA polymerase